MRPGREKGPPGCWQGMGWKGETGVLGGAGTRPEPHCAGNRGRVHAGVSGSGLGLCCSLLASLRLGGLIPQPSPGRTEASSLGPLPPQAALPRRQGNFSKSLSLNLSVLIQAGEALGQGRGLLPRHPAPSPGPGTEMMRRHGNPSLIPALPGPAASPPVPLLKLLLSHRSGLERALPAPSCFRLRELFPLPGTPSPHPSDQLTVPQLLALRASLSPEQPFPALRLNSSLPRSPPLPAEPPPQRLPVNPGGWLPTRLQAPWGREQSQPGRAGSCASRS